MTCRHSDWRLIGRVAADVAGPTVHGVVLQPPDLADGRLISPGVAPLLAVEVGSSSRHGLSTVTETAGL